MEFSFEDHAYNKALNKLGNLWGGSKLKLNRVLIPILICWVPLAIITLMQGTFWTGETDNSFITNFDTQARLLVSMPIFLLAEKPISRKLGLILGQFLNSGIIIKEEKQIFQRIIQKRVAFLKSHWTDIAVLVLCYVHVISVLLYESEYTSMLSWQMVMSDGEEALNFAGKWSALVSRPFMLFLFYRWFLRIIIWGIILRKISKLNLNLFAVHPDLAGGLGFLGYSLRFFAPVAFAISATVAGNMADFMLIEGLHLDDVKIPGFLYLIFITLLFALPLLSFTSNLAATRERSVFENYDFANGLYREFRKRLTKGFEKVTLEDLKAPDFSAVGDFNAVMENSLKMKYAPFILKDLFPLWVAALMPFLGVVLLEIPVSELFQKLISFLV